MRSPIPVIAIAGSLGSGKTSLINGLLASGSSALGVIVNDFGEVNIDVMLVNSQVDATRDISGGCLCCIADTSELDDALRQLTGPRSALDAVIVESSGFAEPRALARIILASDVSTARFGGMIVVVDAQAWARNGKAPDSLPAPDQLAVAGLVVANKIDALTGDSDVHQLRHQLRERGCPAPVYPTTDGRVPQKLLFDSAERTHRTGQLSFADLLTEHVTHDHHHHAHQAVTVTDSRGVSPEKLIRLLDDLPRGVVRAKVVTHLPRPTMSGAQPRYAVHSVGGVITADVSSWPAHQPRESTLVALGFDMDQQSVESELRSVLTDRPVSDAEVNALRRYVRTAPEDNDALDVEVLAPSDV